MNPWIILGWMLVGILALTALWVFVRFFLITVILAVQMARSWRDEARVQRAQDGKLECEVGGCHETATHSAPGRKFYCREHVARSKGLVIPLRHTRRANSQEDK